MFGRQQTTNQKIGISVVWMLVLILLFFFFIFFVRLATQQHGLGSMNRRLARVYPFDPEAITSIAAAKELLIEQVQSLSGEQLLNLMIDPLQNPKSIIVQSAKQYFPVQFTLLHELSEYKEDIQSLLGFTKEQSYLIVLQNVAEKRPNGGFFGSFALVTLEHGKVKQFEMSDSYHPLYDRPQAKLLGPNWLENFLPDRDIYFVGANKVGFTYHDGAHIKTLYEKSYPGKTIRGVVFLRTDMFESLLDGFSQQLRHWQYVNACVDLIRGDASRGKKQLYLSSLQDFLKDHTKELLQEFIMQLPRLLEQRMINVYFEDISGSMHTRLRKRDLTTRFEENHAYFWDSNTSFNKIDRFVTKSIRLLDDRGSIIGQWSGDIVNLPSLQASTTYTWLIEYMLHVPEEYHAFIRSMNEQYGITLGQREEHILGLSHVRSTRGVVYLLSGAEYIDIQGDVSKQEFFDTPFAKGAMYETSILANDEKKQIKIRFRVK